MVDVNGSQNKNVQGKGMKIRLAVPVEAEECWNIRNQAIRYGCKSSYDDAVIAAWTPEKCLRATGTPL